MNPGNGDEEMRSARVIARSLTPGSIALPSSISAQPSPSGVILIPGSLIGGVRCWGVGWVRFAWFDAHSRSVEYHGN